MTRRDVSSFDWDKGNEEKKFVLFQQELQIKKKGVSMKKIKLKPIPKFKTERQERRFWQTHDSTEYLDWSKADHWSFPNLKLTSKPITLRLPIATIDRVKIEAHKMDIPYQTLLKRLIAQGLTML